MVIYYTTKW